MVLESQTGWSSKIERKLLQSSRLKATEAGVTQVKSVRELRRFITFLFLTECREAKWRGQERRLEARALRSVGEATEWELWGGGTGGDIKPDGAKVL